MRVIKSLAAIAAMWCMAAPALAADLDAPVKKTPTNRTEIQRGKIAEFDCSAATNGHWPAFPMCIARTVTDQTRKGNRTAPFDLGLYLGAYLSLDAIMHAALEVMHVDLRKDPDFVATKRYYYEQIQNIEKALSLTHADACKAAEYKIEACNPLKPPP
jgi:hypothetical protein